MGSFADYWENAVLNHLFDGSAYTAPTIHIGLSTADPLDNATGLAEPSGGSYARIATATTDWDTSSAGATANTNELSFPEATASWGTCTHFALFDAGTAGNMLAHGSLSVAKTIGSGDTAKFAIGDLDVTLD